MFFSHTRTHTSTILIFFNMKANKRTRLMYIVVSNYFYDWNKSYWELDWTTTDNFREFADLFRIQPKPGATSARTLYERLQEYHFKNRTI